MRDPPDASAGSQETRRETPGRPAGRSVARKHWTPAQNCTASRVHTWPGGPGWGVRPSDGAPVLWLGLNRDARTGGSRGPRFPRQTSLVTTRVPPGGPRTRWATGSTDALSLCPCDGGAPPPTLWGAKAISWGQRGTGSKAGNPVQGHIQVPLTTQLAKSPDLSWPVS